MRSLAALALTASLVAGSAATAQSIPAGTRARVTGSDVFAPIVGIVQSIRNDTLLVLEEGSNASLWKFRTSEVKAFEVSDGTKGFNRDDMARWGLIGLGAGAVSSVIADVLLNKKAAKGYHYNYGKGLLVGGGIGAGIGLAYGASRPMERWRNIPVPRRIVLTPGPSGAAVGSGFTF